MSPQDRQEIGARGLGLLINVVTEVLDVPCSGARSTTLRRAGPGEAKGSGKEPAESFYFAHEPLIRGKEQIDLEIDPPPDLAIEVDNTSDSEGTLPIHAVLGVPEVW